MKAEKHVVFGTGPVGRAIIRELQSLGKEVHAVNRSGRTPLPQGVCLHRGDASIHSFSQKVCQGATHVYQCVNPPYHLWADLFPPLQESILEAAANNQARLITLENLYGYGDPQGKPFTEDTPMNPNSKKGEVRARMTEGLFKAHQEGRVNMLIGRASDFIGPEVHESVLGIRVIPSLLQGKPVQWLGDPDQPHTYTYMPDIGKNLVRLGQAEDAFGQAWHLPSPPTRPSRETLQEMAARANQALKINKVPRFMLQVLGWFNPVIGEIPEMYYQFIQPFVMDHSKFDRRFGPQASNWEAVIGASLSYYLSLD